MIGQNSLMHVDLSDGVDLDIIPLDTITFSQFILYPPHAEHIRCIHAALTVAKTSFHYDCFAISVPARSLLLFELG